MYETNSWDDNDVISKSLKIIACLFVCLGVIVPLEISHSYGDVIISGEGLQIFTYARHS